MTNRPESKIVTDPACKTSQDTVIDQLLDKKKKKKSHQVIINR